MKTKENNINDVDNFLEKSVSENKILNDLYNNWIADLEIVSDYCRDEKEKSIINNFNFNKDSYLELLSDLSSIIENDISYTRSEIVNEEYYKTLREYEKYKGFFLDDDDLNEFSSYFYMSLHSLAYNRIDSLLINK